MVVHELGILVLVVRNGKWKLPRGYMTVVSFSGNFSGMVTFH